MEKIKDPSASKVSSNSLEMPSKEGSSQGRSFGPPAFQLKASTVESEEVSDSVGEAVVEPKQLVAGDGAGGAGDNGGSGGGLPNDMRSSMEQMSGMDLSDIKVHKNSGEPQKVGALAYAQGSNIHLGPGQDQHLAHEAWHTVQQKQGRVSANTTVNGAGVNDQSHLENEADAMGAKAMQMKANPSSISQLKPAGSGAANSTKAIQRVTPDPVDLVAEYQGWTVESLKRDIAGNLYDSIQSIQTMRIDSWLGNAGIQETKPGAILLGIALDILSAGIGKVLGGAITSVIEGTIAKGITQSFIDGLAGKSLDMVMGAATDGLKSLASPAAQDSASAASRGVAITAQNGLPQYYAEGAKLLLLDAKTTNVSNFNGRSAGYDRNQLMVMHKGLKLTFAKLRDDPSAFMQSLSIGYVKLQDEISLHDRAASFEGSTDAEKLKNMWAQDQTINEVNAREGNLIMLGPMGGIGEYTSPNPSINAATTSGINKQTREYLTGARIDDIPSTVSFRFWGSTPNRGMFGDVFCKVWFTRRPDGTISVDLDQDWERDANGWDAGREWLARFATGYSIELDEDTINANVAAGARKLYNMVKGMTVPKNVMSSDLF